MALVIEDNVSGYLKQLGLVAPNYINEALSKGAYIFYKKIQEKATTYNDDNYSQFHYRGRRGIIAKGQTARRGAVVTAFGKPYERFSRTEPNTHAKGAASLAQLTRWRVYYGKMKAVIGWMGTGPFRPLKIENGEIKGEMKKVKGTSLYEITDTGRKENIGQMMEHGGTVHLTEKQKKFFMASGMLKTAQRGYVIRKARPVVDPAYAMGKAEAERIMLETVQKIVDYKAKNNTPMEMAI